MFVSRDSASIEDNRGISHRARAPREQFPILSQMMVGPFHQRGRGEAGNAGDHRGPRPRRWRTRRGQRLIPTPDRRIKYIPRESAFAKPNAWPGRAAIVQPELGAE